MDSLEYKKLLTDFSKNLQNITETLENAADGDLSPAETEIAIENGKSKIAEYEAIIKRLTNEPKVLTDQFVGDFDYSVSSLMNNLKILTSQK